MEKSVATTEKPRLTYMDVCKAIGIIAVVVVHACSDNDNTYLASHSFIIRFFHAFAMPLFFFINGYLYKNKNVDKPVTGVLKKIKAYYLPFVAYNLFFLFTNNIFVSLHMLDEKYGNGYYDLKEFIRHFFRAVTGRREYFSGALWFLGSILTISAIVIAAEFVIHKVFHDKYKYQLLGVVAVVCLLAGNSGYVTDSMKIATSLAHLIYFYFGMVYRQYDWNAAFLKRRAFCIIVALLVNILISGHKLYNPFGCQSLLVFTILDYVNAFICIVGIMMFAQIGKVMGSRILQTIGTNTMDIMALHFMIFKLVSLVIIAVYQLPITRLPEYPVIQHTGGAWWILYTIVGLTVPTVFSIWRHKIFGKKRTRKDK